MQLAARTKDSRVVSVREFARIFQINPMLVYRLCREGKIPCLRFGTRVVIPCAVVDRLLENPASLQEMLAAGRPRAKNGATE